MSEYDVIVDDDEIRIEKRFKYGCLNMLLWDLFFITFFVIYTLRQLVPAYGELHIVFQIIIGLIFTFTIQWLYTIRFLGGILHIAVGVLYQFLIWHFAEKYILEQIGDDKIWYWTIRILIGILCVGLHFGSYEFQRYKNRKHVKNVSIQNDSFTDLSSKYEALIKRYDTVAKDFRQMYDLIQAATVDNQELIDFTDNMAVNYNSLNDKIEACLNTLEQRSYSFERKTDINEIEKYIDTIELYKNEIQKKLNEIKMQKNKPNDNNGFSLFAGCDTIEKLKVRYKNLAKNYHPDTDSGDQEAMKVINREYESLLNEFTSKSV